MHYFFFMKFLFYEIYYLLEVKVKIHYKYRLTLLLEIFLHQTVILKCLGWFSKSPNINLGNLKKLMSTCMKETIQEDLIPTV